MEAKLVAFLTALLTCVYFSFASVDKSDSLHKSIQNDQSVNMHQKFFSHHTIKKRSLRNLMKRDAGSKDPWCEEQAQKVKAEVAKFAQDGQPNKLLQKVY